MRKRSFAALFLSFIPLIAAQQPPNAADAATPTAAVQAPSGPGADFKFTKVDDDLLNQVNAIDSQYEARGFVLHDPDVQEYIDRVGKRVLGNRPAPEKVTYRFFVLCDPMVNAFALPNGSIYVTTGLLALLENEAQLASVLGHETAHVYERHSYFQNRSVRKKTVAAEIISLAAAWVPGGYAYGLAAAAAANVSTLILVETVYGYSRDMESQADSDGIAAITEAGYNPHAMAVTFELLDQDRTLEYEPHPTFYQDHPKLTERRGKALVFADAHTLPGAQIGSREQYVSALAPAIAIDISADLESRRPRTAVARAARLAEAFPGNPQYQLLLGESYRALGAKTKTPTPDELTQQGEDQQRKLVLKMTEEQEQQQLLAAPGGRATLQQNQAAAEKHLLAAIQEQPDYALAYRELGFLYEDESRYSDAAANYQHYLQLVAHTSLDRLRIERRLAAVQSHQTGQGH